MNAEVEIHVGQRDSVLAVPNAALRTPKDVASRRPKCSASTAAKCRPMLAAKKRGSSGNRHRRGPHDARRAALADSGATAPAPAKPAGTP